MININPNIVNQSYYLEKDYKMYVGHVYKEDGELIREFGFKRDPEKECVGKFYQSLFARKTYYKNPESDHEEYSTTIEALPRYHIANGFLKIVGGTLWAGGGYLLGHGLEQMPLLGELTPSYTLEAILGIYFGTKGFAKSGIELTEGLDIGRDTVAPFKFLNYPYTDLKEQEGRKR